ncbi:MAG TPA: CpsB/CapC family capsule biosynthesis tyrosine phosphatase [Pyrinomonadaceae bacterium]
MIDLRCHLLEEGGRAGNTAAATAAGPDEALRMCHLAAGEGVSAIVAPLKWPGGARRPPLDFEEYARRLDGLRRGLGDAGPRLVSGFVLELSEDLPALVEEYGTRLAIGGGHYLLVSLPALEAPPSIESVWDRLGRLGFGVVVARPECCAALRQDSARLARWAAGGVILQLDAASITGAHGREAQRFARQLVRDHGSAGRIVVASNAHDTGASRPSLATAAASLRATYGRALARQLVERTPALVVGEGVGGRRGERAASLRRAGAGLLRMLRGGAVQQG